MGVPDCEVGSAVGGTGGSGEWDGGVDVVAVVVLLLGEWLEG